MPSLFKSPEAKEKILSIYDEKLSELEIHYESRYIDTSFGSTHIIMTGEKSNPPLLLIHGSNAIAPIALECYPNLSSKYYVMAVDVLAQPNKSAETRLSMKDDSYGKWMNELMRKLELDQVTLAGFSFGGLVILKTMIYNDSLVKQAIIASPAFIVNGNPLKAIFRIFIPMRRFMSSRNPKYIEKFLSALFTHRDPFAVKFLSEVFGNFEMDFSPVPVIKKKDAAKIKAPLTIIAAKQDILFPGEKLLRRAKSIFTSLQKTLLLENSKHVQDENGNRVVEKIILDSI